MTARTLVLGMSGASLSMDTEVNLGGASCHGGQQHLDLCPECASRLCTSPTGTASIYLGRGVRAGLGVPDHF